MDNNKIIKLIELALENKLISIEDLTNIINKTKNKGVFIENPSEKGFDILEEERLRLERIHEQDSEEYDFPRRKI